MSQKVEGFIQLDGLIEGKIPSTPEGADALRKWVRFAGEHGLRFSLQTDGPNFSLLADNRPFRADTLGANATETISQAVRELLRQFIPPDRAKIFSTLRSVEIRKGEEVQSLYVIGPDGNVAVQDRVVATETAAPPKPISRKEKVRMGLTSGLILLAMIAVSTLFVPYRALWANIRGAAVVVDTKKLAIDASAFADYFTVANPRVERERDTVALVLTLKRTDWQAAATRPSAATQPADVLRERLAMEAIARGYVRIELLDEKDNYVGGGELRIKPLRDKETLDVRIPLSRDVKLARLILTY